MHSAGCESKKQQKDIEHNKHQTINVIATNKKIRRKSLSVYNNAFYDVKEDEEQDEHKKILHMNLKQKHKKEKRMKFMHFFVLRAVFFARSLVVHDEKKIL